MKKEDRPGRGHNKDGNGSQGKSPKGSAGKHPIPKGKKGISSTGQPPAPAGQGGQPGIELSESELRELVEVEDALDIAIYKAAAMLHVMTLAMEGDVAALVDGPDKDHVTNGLCILAHDTQCELVDKHEKSSALYNQMNFVRRAGGAR